MIQINKILTDSTGGEVPSGSLVRFRTTFEESGLVVSFGLFCYKNQTAAANKKPYVPVEITNFAFSVVLTEQEYATFELGGAATLVHTKVKEFLAAMPELDASDLEIIL